MKTSITKRLLAMLLCLSMLLPNLTGLAAATDTETILSTPNKQESEWKPAVMTEEDCFPDYDTTGGSVSKLLTNDCGNGVSQDNAKSYFRMATNTNLTEFNAYLAKLTGEGFVMQSRTELAAATAGNNNISTRWLSPEKDYVLTVYFTPDYEEVKIVADTGENIVKDYAAGFSYEGGEAVTTPMMTMYGLSMSPNGFDHTTSHDGYNTKRRNCGTLIVIRMPDNSLFVNDGGDLFQWSDEACADFMDFCHKITGTEAGETVVFNTWFVSHAHSDHFYGLPRFIDKYHDEIDIKNVMYSLDDEMLGSTRDMTEVMHMVKAYYPDVKYYNAEAFVNVNSMTETQWDALIDGFHQGDGYWFGTNYDRGLEYMYQLGYSIQQDNIDKGKNREVVAVFISDGGPMQYNYFSGRTTTPSWSDWFSGRIDASKLQTTSFSATNKPDKLVELETAMLHALKTMTTVDGTTVNGLIDPNYLVYAADTAETLQEEAGLEKIFLDEETGEYIYPNTNNAYVRPVKTAGDLSTRITAAKLETYTKDVYFYLQVKDTMATFYSVMNSNGIRMDERMFDLIARENGIECDSKNMTREEIAAVDAQLLALAQDGVGGKVKYPHSIPRRLSDPNATNLYESMEALLGYEVTLNTIVEIAYRTTTVDMDGDGVQETSIREMLPEIMAEVTALEDGNEWGTLSPYAYFYNKDGKNWWAEAVKGDTDKLYPVVNKYAYEDNTSGNYDENAYYGTVRNNYDSGTGAAYDGKDYIAGYRGLGIPIYTLGVSIGGIGYISNDDTVKVLENIASGKANAFSVYSQDDLSDVFASITSSVTHAAKKAYYVDTLGDAYDLLTQPLNGVTPSIDVLEYALDANHNRTGSVITLEKVTFDGDGVAYSSAIYDATTDENEVPIISHPDIWLDNGVIQAKNFYYNTNTAGTNLDLNGNGTLSLAEGDVVDGVLFMDMSGDGVRDYELQPETFFWILGAVGNTEVVLDYPVYLTGSHPDDPAENPTAGDYPTNESAILYYVNYRNNHVNQETISPEFPWGKARVGYGFYLVDKEGNPIVNAFTGETGSFQNAIKLTRPAYQNLTWNEQLTENSISSASKASSVPVGYSLYVSNVTYYVSANADGTGKWNFQSDTTGTTYVQYGNTYTNTTISDGLNLTDGQTHDTVVWFAVMVNEGDLSTDKTVAKDGENFKLTLEAFANGETSLISDVAPADIVLVLDQSSSMYTPLGWTKDRVNLEDGDTNTSIKAALSEYAITDFVTQGNTAGSEVQENAKRMGYYIAVHNTANYMYLVHYAQVNGVWGWYYISLDQTTRSINLTTTDYVNAVNDSDLGSADYVLCTWAGELMPMMTYYKTQYGALVDSVSSFVEGLKDSGVEHRLGIVGFASPFYDGWKNYDGSGLYVDGNFYLYDTDFMYKGWKNDDGTYHYDTQTSGHIESTWTGASASNTYILDPNTTFLNTPNIQPLSSTVLQNAYANSIICKDSSGKPTGKTMYGEALVDVQTDYDGILASIDAINANYQQTCPSVGIEMAEEIFAARSAETSDRDKIVVLFTDGVPTVRLQSNRHHGYTNNINTKALYWSISGGVEDALDRATEAKANGVQIYTIGTASMQSSAIGGTNINSGDFLKYMSSDYKSVTFSAPTADMIQNDTNGQYATGFDVFVGDPDVSHTDPYNRTRYFTYYDATPDGSLTGDTWSYYYQVSPNEPDETGGYTQFATTGKGSDLNVAFGTVMNAITKPSVTLDAQDILKDVLSDYFDLLGDVDDIKVYTAPFNADGTTGTRVPLESAVVTLGKTDSNSDRYDIINVTGYNYSEEYRSAQPREKDGADYYGSKLIVEIPIAVREGFWGGNNVPTNENISGVYEITGEGENPITLLPIPQVNVPYTPFLTVQDKTVYYGDTNLSHDDLIGEVTVNGKPVTYENGKFVPSESWMDDYAAINWSTGSDNLTTDISSTAPDTYTYTAIFTPVNDGRQETEGGYSNIVGTPIDPNGESISAQGHVYVLVPVITFRDGYVDHFTTPDKTFFEEHNRVTDIAGSSTKNPGVLWQLMGSDQSVSYPAVDTTTEPTLTYTYTTDGTVGGDNPYQSDTRIQVSVNSSNDNATITDVVIFRWEDCDGKLHENGAHTIGEHMGSANIHEFWIHVLTMKDTVVIDFGLDVNVSLLSNDTFASSGNPTLVGLVTQIPATVPATFDTTAQGSFGTLKIQSNGVARYSLNKGEGLLMNTVETFYYVISYTANGEIGYYYGQVNIVPATIVYYEDNFIDFTVEDLTTGDITDGWTPVYTDPDKTDFSDVVQAEDRPGESLSGIDANNIYGKDDAYKTMQKYSMGSAIMFTSPVRIWTM